jgi:pyrroloquinoline quinone (PQQ) biosynthesis protein C
VDSRLEYFKKNAERAKKKLEEAQIFAELWDEAYRRELDAETIQQDLDRLMGQLNKSAEETNSPKAPTLEAKERSLNDLVNDKLQQLDDDGWREYTNQGMG